MRKMSKKILHPMDEKNMCSEDICAGKCTQHSVYHARYSTQHQVFEENIRGISRGFENTPIVEECLVATGTCAIQHIRA